jgi:hypothetical protein
MLDSWFMDLLLDAWQNNYGNVITSRRLPTRTVEIMNTSRIIIPQTEKIKLSLESL